MTAWRDLGITRALDDAVAELGRPAAFDPALLRPALEASTPQAVGERATEMSSQVDALVLAAEEGIPADMLDDVPAIDLADRLDARGMPADLAGWVLQTWGRAVRTAAPDPDPAHPVHPETRPIPIIGLPAAARTVPEPVVPEPAAPELAVPEPAAPELVVPEPDVPQTEERTGGRRRLLLILLAAVVAVLVAVGTLIGTGVLGGSSPAKGTVRNGTRGAGQATPSPSLTPVVAPDVPVALAHRGGSELFPPDTLPAFLAAAKTGTGIEADLRWTSDGVPVIVHEASVEPPMFCAQRYVIAETTWATLRASCLTQASASSDRRSYGIVRLNVLLARLARVEDAQLYLEVKVDQTGAQTQRLLDLLTARGMTDRTVLTSFLPDELAQLRSAAARSGTAGTTLQLMRFVRDRSLTPAEAKAAGLWGIALKQEALQTGYVSRFHAAGLRVVAWTPNTPEQWAAAKAAGVDQLDTDEPVAYRKWAARS